MSVFVSSLIWRHFPEGGGKMTTALALADIADDQGRCIYDDSSALALAKKTMQSERAVKYHLSAMIASGWLQIADNEKGGRGNKAVYRIPVELIPRSANERVQKLQPLPVQQDPVGTPAQPVVVAGSESVQKLHGLSGTDGKGANPDTKGAISDTKGCKTEHPSNMGYVVRKSTSIPPAGADEFPGFTRFWNLWPKTARKGGKAKCLAIWKRKGYEAKTDAILAHVEKMKATENWRTGYDPMPLTYLNRQDWDGADLDAPASGQKPWFINGWSSFIEHGKKHGLLEGDFDAPPDFRAAVLKAEGITPEQIQKAEAEWRAH